MYTKEQISRLTAATYHEPKREGRHIRLAGMDCQQVQPKDARVGDFVYHYSSMLDAFTLAEVKTPIHEDGRGVGRVICRIIDSDSPSEIGTDKTFTVLPDGTIHAYDVYRADERQRQNLEAIGGEFHGTLDWVAHATGHTDTRRKLANRLYPNWSGTFGDVRKAFEAAGEATQRFGQVVRENQHSPWEGWFVIGGVALAVVGMLAATVFSKA